MAYRGYRSPQIMTVLILIGVNVLVFLATSIDPDLIGVLGYTPAEFTERPWMIITSLFVHGSFWHLFGNMLALFFFGSYLAGLIGDARFLFVYFVGGIVGNVLFHLLANPLVTGIGASGAVFALGGTLTVMRPNLRVIIFPIPVPMPLWVAVLGGFFILSFFPGVAWQAHLGGLLVGLASGWVFNRSYSRRPW